MRTHTLIFGALLGIVWFPATLLAVSPTSASQSYASYSVEELETLIAKLQKQLVEMKKGQLCTVSPQSLSLGDGEDSESREGVIALQNFLSEKGYFTYKSTGYFGKITQKALTAFQKNVGVSVTGSLDDATRAKIATLTCKKQHYTKKVSSEVKKDATKNQDTKNQGVVTEIKLTGEGSMVKWQTVGYSKMGYKVVWSKNSVPTYPTRDGDKYQYFSDPNTYKTTLEAFSGAGMYYVRVCEYLGGSCGKYSNEITLSL